jgi:hypothetical protein
MIPVRPVRPADARRLLGAGLRRLDALTLESFTPTWARPRGMR